MPQGRILLRDWLKRWMAERIIPYRRQTTIERYRGIIEREIIPGLGHLDIARLGPGDIQAFQGNLMGRFAPKTVVIIHGVLSGALKHAMRMELIYRNPAAFVAPPQPRSHEVIPAGVELVRAALDLARTEGNPPLPGNPPHRLYGHEARRSPGPDVE